MVPPVGDKSPNCFHGLGIPRRHDLRAHVSNAECKGGLGLRSEITLQLRIAAHDHRKRVREIGSGETDSERFPAVR